MKALVALIALLLAGSPAFAADQDFHFILKRKFQIAKALEAFWPSTESFLNSDHYKIQSAAGYAIREVRGTVEAEPAKGNLPPGRTWHRVVLKIVMDSGTTTVEAGPIGRESYARVVQDLKYDLDIEKP
jgi:hypothetical protein